MKKEILFILFFGIINSTTLKAQDFSRIKYNNANASPDLGVGLWAWPLPLDFDLDGDIDLLVSCPDTPYNGLYFFEKPNRSNNLLMKKPIRIGSGIKNLQVSFINSQPRIIARGLEYKNFNISVLNDSVRVFKKDSLENLHNKIRFSQWKYVDYENDGDIDIIVGIDEWGDYGWDNAFNKEGQWVNGLLHGYVYLLEKINGEYHFKGKIMAGETPIDVYGAPSPNMNDFDGDGDLDLILGEFLDRLNYYENIGSRENPKFSMGKFLENESGIIKMDLEMIIPSAIDWDGDGDIDLIVGDEDGRVALIENTGKSFKDMPLFNSPIYLKQEPDNVKYGALVTPYSVDWDDDGDQDLICGNTAGNIGFIENINETIPPSWAEPINLKAGGREIRIMAGYNGSIQGPAEKKWGYTALSVADWDGDGLKDIIVNSIWGKIEWFKNTGKPGKPELEESKPVKVDWPDGKIPKPEWNWWNPKPNELVTQWRTTPNAIDWNKDGLLDLVVLDHEGYLSYFERFKRKGSLILKPGKRIFFGKGGSQFDSKNNLLDKEDGPLRLNSLKYGKSGRRKWCFVDWDNDGDLDIIINSKNFALFENKGEKKGKVWMQFKGDVAEQVLAGHTTSPAIVDWNKDGKKDVLIGAEDGFLYYFERN